MCMFKIIVSDVKMLTHALLFSLITCDYSDYFNSIGRGGRQLQVPPGLAPWFLPSFLPSKETLKGSFLVWWHQREVGDGAWVPGPNTWDPGPPSSEVPMTHLLCVLCFPAPSRWCPYPLAHSCTGLRLESCVGMLYVHTCVPASALRSTPSLSSLSRPWSFSSGPQHHAL